MKKVLISGMIGNGFEWYDFALYGQMAVILGTLFFPSTDPMLQLLATYSAFAVGFVFRPLGAILFGWIGDKYGRKKALVTAILMMAIPTGAIGLLPTYEQIGLAAPVLLVIIRILQGLSLGGEFGGAITYTVEHASPTQRGLVGSATIVSLIIGFMLGTFVCMLVNSVLPEEEFMSWGWRIPFLLGVVIGIAGFYIRNRCDESPAYQQAKMNNALSTRPVRDTFKKSPGPLLRAFAAYVGVTMPFYLVAIFFIGYMQKVLGLSRHDALLINTIAMAMMLVGMVIGAIVSDRMGRRKVMLAMLLLMMVSILPLMGWMYGGEFTVVLMAQCLLALVVGIYIGPIPALLVEIFPTSVRYTGMSIALNAATVVFGGTVPYIGFKLLELTGTPLSIAGYFIACCMLAFVGLYGYKDRWREPIF